MADENSPSKEKLKKNDVEPDFREVVIIGNGPSAITLSYLLSGHWPYYNGNPLSNEFLQQRLGEGDGKSLVEQDLEFLSQDLEGRSPNPVSVLFDSLNHPDADLGINNPTAITWKKLPSKKVDHIVLGSGLPGGTWQTMDGNVLTISLGNWMELPDLTFEDWEKTQEEENSIGCSHYNRAAVINVARYYADYVRLKNLGDNFLDYHLVTSIVKLKPLIEIPRAYLFQLKLEERQKRMYIRSRTNSFGDFDAAVSPGCGKCRLIQCGCVKTKVHRNERWCRCRNRTTTLPASMFNSGRTGYSIPNHATRSKYIGFDLMAMECSARDGIDFFMFPEEEEDEDDNDSYEEQSTPERLRSITPEPSNVPRIHNSQSLCLDLSSGYSRTYGSYFNGGNFSNIPCSTSTSRKDSGILSLDYEHLEIGEDDEDDDDEVEEQLYDDQLWKVEGVVLRKEGSGMTSRKFSYVTRNVVLAVGNSDKPNNLNIPGEDFPFVLKSLKDLEILIQNEELNSLSDPLLIVGAGLSAADAVIAARYYNIPVIHAFRRPADDKNFIFNKLPVNMYPEYHTVYRMMQDGGKTYEKYKPLAEFNVVEIRPDRSVCLSGPDHGVAVTVSYVIVLIGATPNLDFLDQLGFSLGTVPGAAIDCKANPIDINLYTHESVQHPGLYAMGPLVGDNFVRFLQGGALAVTNHVNQKRFLRS